MFLSGKKDAAPSAQMPSPEAAADAKLKHELGLAAAQHQQPDSDRLFSAGIRQLGDWTRPSQITLLSVENFCRSQSDRSRESLIRWLWAEANAFAPKAGAWEVVRDRARFEERGLAALDEVGAGPESWIRYLRARGAW